MPAPAMTRTTTPYGDRRVPVTRTARNIPLSDPEQFAQVKQCLEADYPDTRVSIVEVDGDTTLRAEHGGMRVFWLYEGEGEVLLPKGYRTQEGGAEPLPDVYQADTIDPAFAEKLDRLRQGLDSLSPPAAAHVAAILERHRGNVFVGDFAAECWGLDHVARPWSTDPRIEDILVSLFDDYRTVGYSTKQADSHEPIMAGDQLIACGKEEIAVRGRFRCLSMEKLGRTESHVSTARRLRYLVDTAGGCSFDFDPYRRLPLTWYLDHPGQKDDGVNFVNAHVVNIPEELSSTHFHPVRPATGGFAQTEMYLVLDPTLHGIDDKGRKPSILIFPDLRDLGSYIQFDLKPGDLVYIPPGAGHRGLDAFVNVLTVPGFKPHNEIYIDQDIHDRAKGKAPYNEDGFGRKNYDRLEDFWE